MNCSQVKSDIEGVRDKGKNAWFRDMGRKLKSAWIGLLLLSGISHASGGPKWILLTRHNDTEVYVDDASITRHGKLMQAWDRTDYPSSQTMTFAPFKQYGSMKALGYYDCAAKTAALRELVLYSGASCSGEVVSVVLVPEVHLDFKPMNAGSVGAVLLKYVCGDQ